MISPSFNFIYESLILYTWNTSDLYGYAIVALNTSEVFINDTLTSNIILLGDSNFISDDVGGGIQENTDLVLNAIDFLMGDEELVSLRSRKVTTRPLEEISDGSKKLWKWANRLLPFILVLLMALYKYNSENMRESRLRREFRWIKI